MFEKYGSKDDDVAPKLCLGNSIQPTVQVFDSVALWAYDIWESFFCYITPFEHEELYFIILTRRDF